MNKVKNDCEIAEEQGFCNDCGFNDSEGFYDVCR